MNKEIYGVCVRIDKNKWVSKGCYRDYPCFVKSAYNATIFKSINEAERYCRIHGIEGYYFYNVKIEADEENKDEQRDKVDPFAVFIVDLFIASFLALAILMKCM